MKKHLIIAFGACLTITGCSSEEELLPSSTTQIKQKNAILNEQLQALEKANGVQQMVLDAETKRRQILEGQNN